MKFYTILFILSTLYLNGQSPVLITDFNAGSENAFELAEYYPLTFESIAFKNGFIFPLNSSETGIELGKYQNGELTIIKDINPGDESSSPAGFYLHNNKVYFSADDGEGKGKLWETDGTEDGTVAVAYLGTSQYSIPEGFISSKTGKLFFTYSAQLLSYKEGILDTIDHLISFGQMDDANLNYCAFGDGIAFIDDYSYNDFVGIFNVVEDEVNLLASSEELSFAGSFEGFVKTENGLYFTVSASNDSKGTYFFNSIDSTISFVYADEDKLDIHRIYSLDDESAIGFNLDTGYYIIQGDSAQLFYEFDDVEYVYKQALDRVSYEGKFIFLAKSSDFYSQKSLLIHSDGTTSGSKEIAELQFYNSNIVTHENLAIFADGITNGKEPNIYIVDIETGDVDKLFEYTLSSDNLHSINILGVVDNELIYISNLDTEVGREMYSLSLEKSSNVKQVSEEELNVKIYPNHFEILNNRSSKAEITIYSIDGQLVDVIQAKTNTMIPKLKIDGIFIYNIKCDGKERVVKINDF